MQWDRSIAARSRRGERVAAPDGLPVIHRKRGATRILGGGARSSLSLRRRVSRSDAHRDAEHAEECRTRCLLSMAGAILSNKTNLCENCYNPVCALCRRA
jgi:hypothetical protein